MADQQTLDSSLPQSDDLFHSQSTSSSSSDPSLSKTLSSTRLNADAPAFVPNRTMKTPLPPHGLLHMYHPPPPPPPIRVLFPPHLIPHAPYPLHQRSRHYGNSRNHGDYQPRGGVDGVKEADLSVKKGDYERRREYKRDFNKGQFENEDFVAIDAKTGLSQDIVRKIVKQVDYYFSDINLATTEHLMRFISNDPEGYVPMHVVSSFKKVKCLVNTDSQLAKVLQNSSKLVVSEDETKVKRLHPITQSAIGELQSRIVIAENLPEDHCYKNLLNIFSVVGSVKNIRTCEPQNFVSGHASAVRSAKNELNTKLHAFVEYEIVEMAEKAVAELNEGDGKSGLRVKLMPQHQRKAQKHVQGRRKKEEDDVMTTSEQDCGEEWNDYVQELTIGDEEQGGDKVNGGQRKGRNRGRGKGRGRGQNQASNENNHHIGRGNSNYSMNNTEQPKQHQQPPPPGPRMPDGTKGFSLGRGKPLTVQAD